MKNPIVTLRTGITKGRDSTSCKSRDEFLRYFSINLILPFLMVLFILEVPSCSAQSAYVTRLGIFDDGKPSGEPLVDTSVDTIQGSCDDGGTSEPEPFFDTYVALTITNKGTSTLRLNRLRYTIPRANGRNTYQSPPLGFSGALQVAPDSSATIYAPIISQLNNKKKLPGSRLDTTKLVGFRTVQFTVNGSIANRPTTLAGALTISFGDYNRCR